MIQVAALKYLLEIPDFASLLLDNKDSQGDRLKVEFDSRAGARC